MITREQALVALNTLCREQGWSTHFELLGAKEWNTSEGETK